MGLLDLPDPIFAAIDGGMESVLPATLRLVVWAGEFEDSMDTNGERWFLGCWWALRWSFFFLSGYRR